MTLLLLAVIYLAFIGLGLPDSLLGAAWPVMRADLGVPLEAAGLVSMITLGATIISSFASGAVLKRLTAARVALASTVMTAAALAGFSAAPSFFFLLVCAVPLGLGAGSIDAALNYYVAKHYRAHHMNWLHCFWGVGAAASPIVISRYIAAENSWRGGTFAVSSLLFVIAAVLFAAQPLWRKADRGAEDALKTDPSAAEKKEAKPFGIPGVKFTLASFLFYCGAETSVGLWGSSYLVSIKGLNAAEAARWVSLYYAGIMTGRFLTGFASFRFGNRALIRTGQLIALSGAVLLLLPLPAIFSLAGLGLLGLGFAPVFPSMIHETPARFGRENAAAVIGLQMGFAYIGSTFLPPLLGLLSAQTTLSIFPFFILACLAALTLTSERLNRPMKSAI